MADDEHDTGVHEQDTDADVHEQDTDTGVRDRETDADVRDHDVRQVIPRDAIPSVVDPEFAPVSTGATSSTDSPADALDADDDVIVVESGGDARAYPVRFLHYHEIVNDVIDGVPIAVTWCPLCGSAVVYDRRVPAGAAGTAPLPDGERTLTFGVSGKLADDDLVMYDRETESEWKQSSGRAIAGPLAGTDLVVTPAAMTTMDAFRDADPEGTVLVPPGGRSEAAGAGDEPEPIDYDEAPYERYFETAGFGLGSHRGTGGRDWNRTDIDPKTVVLGVERGGDALGFPLPAVEDAGGVVTATVGGQSVVVFATEAGIHAFVNPDAEWRRTAAGFRATLPDGSGALYDGVTGRPVDAPAAHTGESGGIAADPLERLPAGRLFAFAWQDDHGPDAFWKP